MSMNGFASDCGDAWVSAQQIGTLQRRRIQADVIKPIYEVMVRELGQDKARRRKVLRFSLQIKA
jgi:hypothetical protein